MYYNAEFLIFTTYEGPRGVSAPSSQIVHVQSVSFFPVRPSRAVSRNLHWLVPGSFSVRSICQEWHCTYRLPQQKLLSVKKLTRNAPGEEETSWRSVKIATGQRRCVCALRPSSSNNKLMYMVIKKITSSVVNDFERYVKIRRLDVCRSYDTVTNVAVRSGLRERSQTWILLS